MGGFIDYYKILGVSRNASEEEIKSTYRNLVKKYHPDHNPDDEEAKKMTQKINEAYEHLGNESKNTKRQEYNRQYDAYYAEKARQQQANQRQQKQQESNQRSQWTYSQSGPGYDKQTYDRKSTSSTHASTSNTDYDDIPEEEIEKTFWSEVKKAWKEVREEEKKEPFFDRHATVDRTIKRKDKKSRTKHYYYYDEKGSKVTGSKTRPRTTQEEVVFHLKRGTLHIAYETLIQLEKLTHITEDTVPKFILRNRNVLAATLAVCILAGGSGMKTSETDQPQTPIYSTSTNTPLPTENMDFGAEIIDGEEERKEEAKINQDYKVYRTYTIQYGDTLSEIAEDANCSVEEIQRDNSIWNSSLIKAGQDIVIPYYIEKGDLKYATFAAFIPEGTSLEDFADRYSTTVESIIALNEEAISGDEVLSDSLLVPNFNTPSEIREQKASSQEKTYTFGG